MSDQKETSEFTAEEINEAIENKFGIRLMTCPNCGGIVSTFDIMKDRNGENMEEGAYRCNHCGEEDDETQFGDLFYD